MLRGRWASTKTTKHYIQFGPAALMSVDVPAAAAAKGVELEADVLRAISLAQRE